MTEMSLYVSAPSNENPASAPVLDIEQLTCSSSITSNGDLPIAAKMATSISETG